MRYTFYDAVIVDRETGQSRLYRMNLEWDTEDPSTYWWREGNFSCDCNRGDCFHRSAGEEDVDYSCAGNRFSVPKLIFPDGSEQKIDD